MKLNRKISLATGTFTTLLLLFLGSLVFQQWFSAMHKQMELSARDQAITIAGMEGLQRDLIRSNGSIPIQRKMESLRLATRSQYIYVLNREGQFYSHNYPSKLGTFTEDDFLLDLLDSPRVIIRKTGTSSFPTVEGIAPVFYQGETVGLVVTGLLNGRVFQEISLNIQIFIFFLIVALFISLYSSKILSYSIKKSMSGLEPREISRLLGQRAMTLENLREGIITVDQDGKIVYFNASAAALAGLKPTDQEQPVDLYSFSKGFRTCMEHGIAVQQELYSRIGNALHYRFEPIREEGSGQILGATALLEDLTTVRVRAEELTGIKQINEGLRAQNHEFLNKLHTIAGLIELEEYDEAVGYISEISHSRTEISGQLNRLIREASTAGLLLGKYNKASEQKTLFQLDENSFLPEGCRHKNTVHLVLGNLIENSLEELAGRSDGKIFVSVRSERSNLFLEVRDNGRGLPDREHSFEKGFSSKGEGRGLGLYMVAQRVRHEEGEIRVVSNPGECRITVTLPLNDGPHEGQENRNENTDR